MRAKPLLISLCLTAAVFPANAVETAPADLVQEMGLKAGRWHTVGKFESIELTADPGGSVPEDLRARLQGQVGRIIEGDDCIGPGLATNGQLILPSMALGCPASRMDAESGRLAIDATCNGTNGGLRTDMNIEATYSDETMSGRFATTTHVRDPGYTVKAVISTNSRYAGQCPPGVPATPRPLTQSLP
jgi:hypothetical protein